MVRTVVEKRKMEDDGAVTPRRRRWEGGEMPPEARGGGKERDTPPRPLVGYEEGCGDPRRMQKTQRAGERGGG